MRTLDRIAAWLLFATGFVSIVVVGFWHPREMFLDEPVLWIVVAMVNFVRFANEDSPPPRLRRVSIAANLMTFALGSLGIALFASRTAASWGFDYAWRDFRINFLWWFPYFLGTTLALVETICSLRQTNRLGKSAAA